MSAAMLNASTMRRPDGKTTRSYDYSMAHQLKAAATRRCRFGAAMTQRFVGSPTRWLLRIVGDVCALVSQHPDGHVAGETLQQRLRFAPLFVDPIGRQFADQLFAR